MANSVLWSTDLISSDYLLDQTLEEIRKRDILISELDEQIWLLSEKIKKDEIELFYYSNIANNYTEILKENNKQQKKKTVKIVIIASSIASAVFTGFGFYIRHELDSIFN